MGKQAQTCIIIVQLQRFISVEESQYLSTNLLAPSFLVVHDATGGGHDNLAKETRGQESSNPALDLVVGEVVPRGNDSALVEAPVQGNDDLSRSMVVHENELVDVSVLEHDLQEFDDNLGGGTDQDLCSPRSRKEREGKVSMRFQRVFVFFLFLSL